MKIFYKKLFFSTVASLVTGAAMVVPIVTSENGYSAGLIMSLLILLLAGICVILFIIGFAFLFRENMIGLCFLLAMLALPTGFFGTAITAKQFELGAYREEPMTPIAGPVANKVFFKKGSTHEEIERFWTHVIGYPTNDRGGHSSHPGVRGGFRPGPENGHEVIAFEFRSDATEEEKADIRERIKNYPPVHQYLENVDTTPIQDETPPPNPGQTKKAVTVNSK